MIKQASIGLRLSPLVKKALETAAEKDSRSVSSLVVVIVTDWLKAKGYIKDVQL